MKKNGFTLLELLVVIAVISLLTGILIPVLRAAKKQAQSLQCSSNLSQIALMMAIYDDEHYTFPCGFNDQVMLAGGGAGDLLNDCLGKWWLDYLIEGQLEESVAWCPSRTVPDSGIEENILCLNYGVNRSICKDGAITASAIPFSVGSDFSGKPLSQSQIRNPSQTLLAVDSGYSLVSWQAAAKGVFPRFDNVNRENFFYIPGMSINMTPPVSTQNPKMPYDAEMRHINKTVNVIFTDGHLGRVKADKLEVNDAGDNFETLPVLWKPQ